MNVLVCGGAGFIGSHFIRYILNKYPDYSVVNFDKLTYAGNLDNLRDVANNPRYFFVRGDICDKKAVMDVCLANKIDTIVNFAAESHVDRSIQSGLEFIKTLQKNGMKRQITCFICSLAGNTDKRKKRNQNEEWKKINFFLKNIYLYDISVSLCEWYKKFSIIKINTAEIIQISIFI